MDDKEINYNHFGAGKTVFELEDLCIQDGCIIRAGNIDDYNLGFGYNTIILSKKNIKLHDLYNINFIFVI